VQKSAVVHHGRYATIEKSRTSRNLGDAKLALVLSAATRI
jgi:hypothetical protein